MDPSVWGPSTWFIMHSIALNYPESPSYVQQRNHHDFYHSLRNVLPCEICREHFTELLKTYPIGPSLNNRTELIKWVNLLHNKVNLRYGKPEVSTDEMYDLYNNIYSRGSFCEKMKIEEKPTTPTNTTIHPPPKQSNQKLSSKKILYIGLIILLCVLILIIAIKFIFYKSNNSSK